MLMWAVVQPLPALPFLTVQSCPCSCNFMGVEQSREPLVGSVQCKLAAQTGLQLHANTG